MRVSNLLYISSTRSVELEQIKVFLNATKNRQTSSQVSIGSFCNFSTFSTFNYFCFKKNLMIPGSDCSSSQLTYGQSVAIYVFSESELRKNMLLLTQTISRKFTCIIYIPSCGLQNNTFSFRR